MLLHIFLSRGLSGPESIMSCMLSGLLRLLGGLHPLLSRSLSGPESIMYCMMLSGLPRLVGALHLQSSFFIFCQIRILGKTF